jgi:hypothetical protein
MTRIVLAAFFAIISFDASALVRYMVQGMTCAEVKEALERDDVAILFRPGKSGVTLYDRYVKDGSLCASGTMAAAERIASADTDGCLVTKCVDGRRFGG